MSKKDKLGKGGGRKGEKVTGLPACGNVQLTSLFQDQADSRDKMSSHNPLGEAALSARGPLGVWQAVISHRATSQPSVRHRDGTRCSDASYKVQCQRLGSLFLRKAPSRYHFAFFNSFRCEGLSNLQFTTTWVTDNL